MSFPSPAAGHEEKFIGDTLTEHLIRKPSATLVWMFDFERINLAKGDLAVFEVDRRPHDEWLALVEHHGDTFPCQLFWRHEKWFAVTDERQDSQWRIETDNKNWVPTYKDRHVGVCVEVIRDLMEKW